MGVHFAKRSAFDSEIFRIGENETAVDIAIARYDAVAGDFFLFHTEIGAAMLDELADFREAPCIKEQIEPFPGRHLSFFVLLVNLLLTAAHFYLFELCFKLLDLFLHCCHKAPPIHLLHRFLLYHISCCLST